jgi:hypothetical protein
MLSYFVVVSGKPSLSCVQCCTCGGTGARYWYHDTSSFVLLVNFLVLSSLVTYGTLPYHTSLYLVVSSSSFLSTLLPILPSQRASEAPASNPTLYYLSLKNRSSSCHSGSSVSQASQRQAQALTPGRPSLCAVRSEYSKYITVLHLWSSVTRYKETSPSVLLVVVSYYYILCRLF